MKRPNSSLLIVFLTAAVCLLAVSSGDAQTSEQEEKRVAVKKLNAEAMGLFLQATANSLRAAREKFIVVQNFYLEAGEKRLAASTLIITGRISYQLDEYPLALKYLEQSVMIWREIGDQRWEAMTLIPLSAVYSTLGKEDRALEINERILYLSRAVGNKIGEGQALENIGTTYLDRLEFSKALDCYNQALMLYRETGAGQSETGSMGRIGRVYFRMGEQAKALEILQDALKLSRSRKDLTVERIVLRDIGRIFLKNGDKEKALENFQRSLFLYRAAGSLYGEAIMLTTLQDFWRQSNNPRLAIYYGKQSVNKFQQLRQGINVLDRQTQKDFLETIQGVYQKLADVLIAQGRIAEAEEVLAMLKEEEFFAYLRRDDKVAGDLKGRISLSPDEKKAFEDYENYADNITRTAQDLGALEKKKNDLPLGESLTFADQQIYDALKAKYDASIVVFNKFLNDLKLRFGTNDKRVAIVESDTQGILKRLNQPRTAIISTIVGEDRLNLIVTTGDTQRAHTVDIKSADLNKLVADFREAVKNSEVDPRPLGKKLFETLFPTALQGDLDGIKADTIIWSLDGTLRYVPMAALWDGKNYLAERYTNAVLTLASRDKINTSAATDRTKWLALGVGVSKAASVMNADGTTANFDALAAVPQELCSVVNDPKKKEFCGAFGTQSNGLISGLMLPDDEFTLAGFENNVGKVSIVHIASHFALNAGDESDSYLLLGGGTERKFSLISLKKTRLDRVELLTLSACNTAMTSGNNSSGVEIEGFGALAQNQGAKTVLATLWAVADDSTRDLMTEFYGELERDSAVGKAEALRKAQIRLIRGPNKPEQIAERRRSEAVRFGAGAKTMPKYVRDENAPFAHPFYWSPFVLIGNWR